MSMLFLPLGSLCFMNSIKPGRTPHDLASAFIEGQISSSECSFNDCMLTKGTALEDIFRRDYVRATNV
mgnify:FL=1